MRSVRLLLPSLAAALTLLGAPAPLAAHGALKHSAPASGARLSAVPGALRLTFTERVELAVSRLELYGPDSSRIALRPLRVDSVFTLVADITGALTAGEYIVAWQVAGADGHPVRARFRFTILQGAAGTAAAAAAAMHDPPSLTGDSLPAEHHPASLMPEGPGFDAESPLYAAVRWLQFIALLLVIGAVAFRYGVLGLARGTQPDGSAFVTETRRRAATIGLWAATLVLLVAFLRLFSQSFALHGAADVLNPSMLGAMLGRTTWGTGWIMQIVAGAVMVIGFQRARDGGRRGWPLVAAGAVVLAFTPALSGHASAVPTLGFLAVAADAAHVSGAAGWLGSLVFVVSAAIPAAYTLPETERDRAVADIVSAFSPTALAFAGLVATSGVFTAWLHLTSVSSLWTTTYGKTLLLKVAILSVVAGTGAYNWLRVKPALGNPLGTKRVRRSASFELGVGVLVLAITAFLVATPTPMDEPTRSAPTLPAAHGGMQNTTR